MDGDDNKVQSYSVKKQHNAIKRLRRFTSSKKINAKILILLPLLVILSLAYYFLTPEIKIGNKGVSRITYRNIMRQAKAAGVSGNDAKSTLISVEKKKQAAEKLKINYNTEQIDEILNKYYSKNSSKANEWQKLNAIDSAISNNILTKQTGGYRGSILYFPFSRNFYSVMFPKSPPFGEPNTIADDKKYAETKAKEYRQKLQTKSITDEKAILEIQKDERLILGPAANLSKKFTVDYAGFKKISGNGLQEPIMRDYLTTLSKMKAGEISEIMIYKTRIPFDTSGKALKTDYDKEIQFYFIKLDTKTTPDPNIEQNFVREINTIRVR